MQIRIRKLPEKSAKKNIFMTLTNDKKMEIYLTYDKRFHFKTGTEIKTTKPFDLANFKWYTVKVIYTRLVYANDFFDCSVEIDIMGVGRDGHSLYCKSYHHNQSLRQSSSFRELWKRPHAQDCDWRHQHRHVYFRFKVALSS